MLSSTTTTRLPLRTSGRGLYFSRAEVLPALVRLDEGAVDVAVGGQSVPVGEPGLLGVAVPGGDGGEGDGDHQVRLDGVLQGQWRPIRIRVSFTSC